MFENDRTNADLSVILHTYPDKVAEAMAEYKKAMAETKRIGAKLYLELKAVNVEKDIKEAHLRAMVQNHPDYYAAQMKEIETEAIYTKVYETLLCTKKLAALRTAF